MFYRSKNMATIPIMGILIFLLMLLLAACGEADKGPGANAATATIAPTATVAPPTPTATTKAPTPTVIPATTATPALSTEQLIVREVLVARKLTTDQAKVVVQKIEGDYARVSLTPAKPTEGGWEGGFIFLKQEGKNWKELMAGTAFMPEDLQSHGIPRSLWNLAN